MVQLVVSKRVSEVRYDPNELFARFGLFHPDNEYKALWDVFIGASLLCVCVCVLVLVLLIFAYVVGICSRYAFVEFDRDYIFEQAWERIVAVQFVVVEMPAIMQHLRVCYVSFGGVSCVALHKISCLHKWIVFV